MNEPTCRTCHATGTRHTPLVRDDTGERVVLCPACLRSAVDMQADARDEHGRRRLADHADLHGLHLWSAPHVAYVLRPMADAAVASLTERPAPAAPATTETRMTPVTVPHA